MKTFLAQFIASDRLNTKCDEVFNIDCDNRFSDLGFQDQTKVMLRPRAGTEKVGRLPSSIGTPKDAFWFVGTDNVKYGFISKGGEVYKTTHSEPGKYLGYFQNQEDAAEVGAGNNGDYFIVHQDLYRFDSGVTSKVSVTWVGNFDNEADLYEEYPTPDDSLFAFLKDSDSVYYSEDDVWKPYSEYYEFEAIGLGNSDSPATFNVVTLPYTVQTTDTARDASTIEAIKVSLALEPTAATYVGSYALITSGAYKNKFAYIFDYDTSTKEFKMVGLGNATPIKDTTTYTIYETKGKYLQITNGVDNDKYYDGTAFHADVAGAVKTHLNKFTEFTTGGPGIIRSFGNQCYTAINDTIYISDVAQPLWYNINEIIELHQPTSVDDFFVWKNKMITYGNNFTTFINPSVSSGAERTYNFKNYGIVPGSCAEVLDDFWLLTYSGFLIPLSVQLTGDIYEKKNIGAPVYRYLKNMRQNVTACFDGRKYYIYGEQYNKEGYTCVYDTTYAFWSVYTGIRPAKFFLDGNIVYFIEQGTGDVRRFTTGKVTDSEVALDQYISSKDIDLGRFSVIKSAESMTGYLENRNQTIDIELELRTDSNVVTSTEKRVFEEKTGEGILGYNYMTDKKLAPQFFHVILGNDYANVWRWKITSTGNNGFYLNQLELKMQLSETNDASNIDI